MPNKIYKLFTIVLIPENRIIYVSYTSTHPNIRLYDLSKSNENFIKCINQYGENCFAINIIETNTDLKIIKDHERELIQYYQSISPLFRKGLTERERDTKRDFYNSTLAVWLQENGGPNKGKIMSENEKELHRNNGRNIKIECIETGDRYISISDACNKNNISYYKLSSAIKSNNLTAGGYHWKTIEGV